MPLINKVLAELTNNDAMARRKSIIPPNEIGLYLIVNPEISVPIPAIKSRNGVGFMCR